MCFFTKEFYIFSKGIIYKMNSSNVINARFIHRDAADRKIIKELGTGFVKLSETGVSHTNMRPACGPFRAIMNSGDVLARENVQCGGSNQIPATRYTGMRGRGGSGLRQDCPVVNGITSKEAPVANCNPKFVYNSSDYVRFKHLMAKRKGYNDVTNGGPAYSTVFNGMMSIRR